MFNNEYHISRNDDNEYVDYSEIERKRKEKVAKLAESLISKRNHINVEIEEELLKYPDFVNQNESVNNLFMDTGTKNLETQKVETSVYQKEEKSKIYTNLDFTNVLIDNLILNNSYVSIENQIQEVKMMMPKTEQMKIKLQVNKRLGQVSGKEGQIEKIADVLREYQNSPIFIEVFVLKLIDQGRMQVSSCPDSYKHYSKLFCMLYSENLMTYFRAVLFTRELNAETVKGVYSIYYGVLELQNNVDESWFFIASVLNTQPNSLSCYAVECFFLILSKMFYNYCRKPFLKLVKYVRIFYLTDINNEPCKIRITNILMRY